MGSQAAVHHPPSKQQMARAIAASLPAELSQSPLVGILGVVLGAGIVTLTGRMLTLGTADLKGNLGIGVVHRWLAGPAAGATDRGSLFHSRVPFIAIDPQL